MEEWKEKHIISLRASQSLLLSGKVQASKLTTIGNLFWIVKANITKNDREEKFLAVSVKCIYENYDEKLIYRFLPVMRIVSQKQDCKDQYYQMEPVLPVAGTSFHCDFGCKKSLPWTDITNLELGLISDASSQIHIEVLIKPYGQSVT